MRLFTGFCALWLMCLAVGESYEPKIVCYYRSSGVEGDVFERLDPSEIDPSLCTHLIYGFIRTTEDGDVSVVDPQFDLSENGGKAGFQKFNALRRRNERLKTLVSIDDRGSENLIKVISNASLRSKYAKKVVEFVLRHEFDGMDSFGVPLTVFDDVQNYILLLKELRASFDEHKLILSVQVAGTEVDARWFYDIPQIAKYVDFVLLTVECHKPTDPTVGHFAPLYPASRERSSLDLALNINASVHYWLNQGVPAEKLILGARLYGSGFILKNAARHVPGSPASGELASTLKHVGYKEICRMISQSNWTSVWDGEQRVPYCYAGNRWISYEDVRSLTEKGQYAKALGLGGVVAWNIDQDDHRGGCAERYPLLKALNCGLRRMGCSVTAPGVLPSMNARIVCYYRSWAVEIVGYGRLDPSEIDPNLCTHLVYMFVGITEDGDVSVVGPRIDLPDNGGMSGFQKFNALRKRNEKLKTIILSGGGPISSSAYSKVAADDILRSKYVKNVVDFVLRHEFDGFNINWQHPTINGGRPDDKHNFVLLLKELRASFDEHDLILSITATAAEVYANRFYDIPQISKYVDFIVLVPEYRMYDERTTSHWAPLYPASKDTASLDRTLNIHASIEHWLNQGAPSEKLILGIEFSGHYFTLNNSISHVPGSPTISNAESKDYNEICRLTSQDDWTNLWDNEQHNPYSYKGNQWMSYDNVRSVTEKGKYARAMGLGGVMGFALDMDDHRGDCGERHPLLSAMNCGLREIGCSSVLTPEASTPDDDSDENAKRMCAKFELRYVRHPRNCAKFWICLRIDKDVFHAEPFSCGRGLYFDTVRYTCKIKDMVLCS